MIIRAGCQKGQGNIGEGDEAMAGMGVVGSVMTKKSG